MFEHLRQSLNDLLARATKPEERHLVIARMKGTLVQARLGVDDLRDALQQTRRKLEREQSELLTVRRRKELAVGIKDAETITVAERFERQHEERARILEEKVAVQARELELAEREYEEMKTELRQAASGASVGAPPSVDPLDDPLEDAAADGRRVQQEIDALGRQRARAERDADADRRLEELKRKMGK